MGHMQVNYRAQKYRLGNATPHVEAVQALRTTKTHTFVALESRKPTEVLSARDSAADARLHFDDFVFIFFHPPDILQESLTHLVP